MSWQPIDTAPKDGTSVFLLVNGRPEVGYYLNEEIYRNGERYSSTDEWIVPSTPLGLGWQG